MSGVRQGGHGWTHSSGLSAAGAGGALVEGGAWPPHPPLWFPMQPSTPAPPTRVPTGAPATRCPRASSATARRAGAGPPVRWVRACSRASGGPSLLPRDCAPPRRLDVPPEGKCPAPAARPALSAPAPRLGVGGSRKLPFSSHRAPPALLTRVPSGGPSRYSGGAGRPLLYLGRPEGHRGRALKRVEGREAPGAPEASLGRALLAGGRP